MYKAVVLVALFSIAFGYPAVENTEDDNAIEKIYRPAQNDTDPKEQEAEGEKIVDAAVERLLDNLMQYMILTDMQTKSIDPAKQTEDSEELSDEAIEAVMEEFFKLLDTTDITEEDQERVIEEMFQKLDELLTNFEQNAINESMNDRENKDALNNPGSEDEEKEITNTTPELGTTELVPEIVTTL